MADADVRGPACLLRAGRGVKQGPADWVRNRMLDCDALVLLTAGGGGFEAEGGTQELSAGDLLVLRRGQRHAYGPTEGRIWRESWLLCGGALSEALLAAWMPGGGIRQQIPSAAVRLLEQLVDAWAAGGLDQGQAGLDLHRLVLVALRQRPEAAWLRRACDELANDLQGRWALPALAVALGQSYGYFRRAFRRATGEAPGAYRERHRFLAACRLLDADPGRSIGAVAEELGFCDPFEFSRRFRQHLGCSPSAWRQSWQPDGDRDPASDSRS